ncbi:DUF4349 domain-containing protein [Plantibacter sp. Mn2098]|uniref:DUF4349 domain-containing protein n=1 Tax=Plantibacter sp. Mn2098 TaxID=3395266 RepID=UPI003BBA8944
MRRSSAITVAAASALAAALLLSGCTFGGGSNSSGSAPVPYIPSEPMPLPNDQQGGASGSTSDGPLDGSSKSEAGDGFSQGSTSLQPQVITSGWMTLTDADPIGVAAKVATIVTDAGGRIDSRNETPGTADQLAQSSITVRIPKADFDAVVKKIEGLATVNDVSVSAVDVTLQAVDLDARITALQSSVDRLRALMAAATTTTDLLAAETSLSERQAELDSLVAQRDALRDQVEFSAVTVSVFSPGTVDTRGPDDFWGGIAAGWNALLGAAASSVVVLGFLLPWVVLLLLIAAVVIVVVRLASRRPKAAGAAGTAAPGGHGGPAGTAGPAGPGWPAAGQQHGPVGVSHQVSNDVPRPPTAQPQAAQPPAEAAPAAPDDNAGPR